MELRTRNDRSFGDVLQKMKDSGADTYYIETLNPNGPKAARQLGMFDKTIITEQWLSVPALAEATGAAGEDMVFAGQKCLKPELAAKGDPTAAFCTSYRALWSKYYPGETYALFSVYGNDAVRTFAQAAKRVNASKTCRVSWRWEMRSRILRKSPGGGFASLFT